MLIKQNTNQFVEKAKALHGDNYDYSKTVYEHTNKHCIFVCKVHGEFLQTPSLHLRSKGCAKCTRNAVNKSRIKTTSWFIAEAKKLHGKAAYDYSKVVYVGNQTPVDIVCKEGHEFQQTPNSHLCGAGCPECGKAKQRAYRLKAAKLKRDVFSLTFAEKAKKVHGENNFDYSKSVVANRTTPVIIVCKKGHEFQQTPKTHLKGSGCYICHCEALAKSLQRDLKDFIIEANLVHGEGTYNYSDTKYVGCYIPVDIVCKEGHKFTQRPASHIQGHGCPRCSSSGPSKPELELQIFVEQLGLVSKTSDRTVLQSKEIDLLVGSLGIEYDGLRWHGEKFKTNNYHKEKTELAKSKGIKLIHIFEDEWLEKQHIVKARLAAKLGKSAKTYARKLHLRETTWKEARSFYESNHLQGAGQAGKSVGLYENDTLMACFTVGKRNNVHELLRYASIGTVVGGFSRLLKAFVQANPEITSLISYSDLRWGEGNVYGSNGFKRLEDTQLGYFWCKGSQRFSRQKFQKHKLAAILTKFDPTKTEVQNMHENGYFRIFDCGHAKWEWTRDA